MNGIILSSLCVSLMSALLENSQILILILHSVCDNMILDHILKENLVLPI